MSWPDQKKYWYRITDRQHMKKKSRRQTFVTPKKHSIFFWYHQPNLPLNFDQQATQRLLSHGVGTASFLHPRTNHIIGTLRQRRHPAIQPDDGIPCSPPDSPHSPSSQDSQKPQQNNRKPKAKCRKDSSDTDSQDGDSGFNSEEDHDEKLRKKKEASTGTKPTHAHKRQGIVCWICHQNTTDISIPTYSCAGYATK